MFIRILFTCGSEQNVTLRSMTQITGFKRNIEFELMLYTSSCGYNWLRGTVQKNE